MQYSIAYQIFIIAAEVEQLFAVSGRDYLTFSIKQKNQIKSREKSNQGSGARGRVSGEKE